MLSESCPQGAPENQGKIRTLSVPFQGDMLSPKIPVKGGGIVGEGTATVTGGDGKS